MTIEKTLNEQTLAIAALKLAENDADFAGIIERHGTPPLWAREPGFATLVHIILEQQVSLASAKAAFDKLSATAAPLKPETVLPLDDVTMKAVGVSRQKARYLRHLSESILNGELDLARLHRESDAFVHTELQKIKGIGNWTTSVYLLMALLRPDAWPVGDLALAKALQRLKNLPKLPDTAQLTEFGEQWRPFRAVAARLLWHFYLSEPKN